jgi:hypothetical protein
MSKESKTKRPPYGSFKTAKSFIEKLNKHVLPDNIDRSMMSNMSGDSQTELFSAFRYLGLLGENDTTTDLLAELVKAYGTEKWQEILTKVITQAYKPIIKNLNIETATAKALADCFKNNAGVDGYMAQRSIRFYVAALKEAQIPHSPFFKAPTVKKPKNSKPKKRKPKIKTGDDGKEPLEEPTGNEIPSNMIPLPLFPPPRKAYIPSDITEADCNVIDAMMRAYAKQIKESKSK